MSAASELDTIRLERLAVRGLGAEATAISAARVHIDNLRRSYSAWNPFDPESSQEFEQALMTYEKRPKLRGMERLRQPTKRKSEIYD